MRLAALFALALAACGPGAPATVEDAHYAASLNVDLAHSTKVADGLYFREITAGTGAPATAGQSLSVYYTGWLADGTQFDSNVGKDQFTFVLGAGEVIPGWDFGLAGAPVGSTRQLVIGPSFGYGQFQRGPIPPNSILVFDVQVVSAQ